jgi:hypothetical protein
LYTLGLLNEGRQYAMRFELVRLLVIVPAGVLGLHLDDMVAMPGQWLWIGLVVYLGCSLPGLQLASTGGNKSLLKQKLTNYS